MKTRKSLTSILITAMIGITFVACKKDSTSPSAFTSTTADEQTEVSLATSATSADALYNDAFDVVAQSSEQNSLTTNTNSTQTVNAVGVNTVQTNYTTTAGAIITISPADPSVFPKTMTIDYGTGIPSKDSITRKGQIIVTLTGKIRVAGSTISVTFNNYSVNGYGLTGTYALTPKIASGGGVNYNVTVINGSITFPNGQGATYSGTENFTQVAGIGTTSITDDTYNITGSFSYSSANTGSITGTIATPLVKSADCKNITSGTISFVYSGLNGTLDFGSGTCDNVATIVVGKTTKTITLPK